MKRVLHVTSFVCAIALICALGVSPAFGVGHATPSHGRTKLAAPTTRIQAVGRFGSFASLSPVGSVLAPASGIHGLAITSTELPLESANVSGTVDSGGVADKVFWFFLEKGATIEFKLSPTTLGTQSELYVFQPGSTSVADKSTALLMVADHVYPGDAYFTSPADGVYYVDVSAKAGNTFFTMPYNIYYSPNDNIYPSTGTMAPPITASPMYGSLNAHWDYDDVSSIPLAAGDNLTLGLNAPVTPYNSPDFDVDLYLFDRSATDIYVDAPLRSSVTAASSVENISYTVPSTGVYFADVSSLVGYGYDSLAWRVTPARPTIKLSPSGTKLTYKRKKGKVVYTLSARFSNDFSLPYTGATTYVQWSKNGKTKWANKIKLTTDANGNVGAKVTAKKKSVGYYRWATKVGSVTTYGKVQKVTIK